MQDHFSKYVIAYVVKDQTACTATETLRNGYFGLFGTPAYLVSDQGKTFMDHLITNLCELYGVQKLRTLPYHAQTNGQVEWMNQTIIHMIGKLEQDKKACWFEHLPEMLSAYNGTRSAVTGYSPYFLLFGRKARMPVDYLFPTLHDSPHQTKMEVSVMAMQKRLKEAFAVARHLISQEAAKQWRYYDHKAGTVALQPGDVVMVCTDGFVGKQKVKDQWEEGGFFVHDAFPGIDAKLLLAGFLISYFIVHEMCTGLGEFCERLHVEIFVRVLRSSRVNFNNVNNTNVFCVSELKVLLF